MRINKVRRFVQKAGLYKKINQRFFSLLVILILIPLLFYVRQGLAMPFSMGNNPLILEIFYQKSVVTFVFNILIVLALVWVGFLASNILNIRKISRMQTVLVNKISSQSLTLIEERNRTQKKAEELKLLNATKDKFFSIIAHDLKNPFNSLLGFSDLLKNDFNRLEAHEIKRYIEIIHDSSKHGFNLLENLLQWSRAQTGSIAYYPKFFKLNELIEKCVQLYQNNADKKHIQIFNEVPDNLVLFGDEEMLSTVFRNLVSNAIKFTPNMGKVKIKTSRGIRKVTISIVDTGVGIPEDKIAKLFKIDVQHSTLGTSNEKGTGLGLILCKEFVEKHGGKIKVESERKNGSEFKVILPLKNNTITKNDKLQKTESALS